MIQDAVAADSIRRVVGEVFAGAPYQWRDEADATVLLRSWWRALTDWLSRLAGDNPAAFRALIWGLVALLVAIALHTIWLLIRTTRARPTAGARQGLVATVRRDAAWYAAEVDRLVAAGRYRAALQADFLRLALELDGRDVLHFHPSKTPLEYLKEVPALGGLIGDLYRYAFAGEPCGPVELAAWRSRAVTERYAPGT